uniref:Uncharacterized protein n=1 Tax=Megaselia scalaris TaxID=36166 RepID=T1GLU8_MEGSC
MQFAELEEQDLKAIAGSSWGKDKETIQNIFQTHVSKGGSSSRGRIVVRFVLNLPFSCPSDFLKRGDVHDIFLQYFPYILCGSLSSHAPGVPSFNLHLVV